MRLTALRPVASPFPPKCTIATIRTPASEAIRPTSVDDVWKSWRPFLG